MALTNLNHSICLLVFFILVVSCKGQTKTDLPKGIQNDNLNFTSRSLKLSKASINNKHQNIHCSLEDRNGDIWFGTTGEGVYRYDGNNFTQFTEKDGLSDNVVWSVLEDESGNIWFGTDNGVSRFDGKILSKIPINAISTNGLIYGTKSRKNPVWCMIQDKMGSIYFGTSEDLYIYDGKSFSRFLNREYLVNKQDLRLKYIQCLLEDSSGTIWMGSGPMALEGVIRFDGKSISASKPNGDGWIRYILEDNSGKIWFSGRQNGIFKYDGYNFNSFTEKTNIGAAMVQDKSGNIWFGGEEINSSIESADGIWRYDGKSFINFSNKDGMGKYSVWSMLEDRKGNLWIGTRNNELYRYNGQFFESFNE